MANNAQMGRHADGGCHIPDDLKQQASARKRFRRFFDCLQGNEIHASAHAHCVISRKPLLTEIEAFLL